MKMNLRFEGDQEFQLDAIAAIADLFDGQPRADSELVLAEAGFAAVTNRLDLHDADLLDNLKVVQKRNGISEDVALDQIEAEIDGPDGTSLVCFPNFSIEMETGTGKTYVYLRTALELYQRFGLRKFI